MDQLVQNLGLNWQSLLFQLINFFILLYILKRFAYGPLVKMLDQRKKRIEESKQQADQITKDREDMQKAFEAKLLEAKKEAQTIREQALNDAETSRTAKVQQTKEEITVLLEKAKQDIRHEKDKSLDAVRAEAAGLVIAATEKVLRQKLTDQGDKAFVEQSLHDLTKTSR